MFLGFLKQSTQVTVTIVVVSSTDHISGKTGLSAGLTIYATKAGVSPAAITPTVAEIDSVNMPGNYSLVLTTTHTNTLGELHLSITGSGADPADFYWQVSTYLPGEAATLQADQAVNVTKVDGASLTSHASGTMPADVLTIAGTTQTARDLGASVLLSPGTGAGQVDLSSGQVKVQSGTGSGQLDVTSGRIKADTVYWNASAVATPDTAGEPKVTVHAGTGTGQLSLASGQVTVGTNNDKTGYTLSSTGQTNLLDQTLSGHTTAGTVGGALNSAASATDPWTTTLPGSYTSGQAGAILGNLLANVFGTALTEGYAADGNVPTLAQALFRIMQNLCQFAISGTTLTVHKLDKSTTAETYTLDSETSPTSRTRAS